MTIFEHLGALMSFVLALAITTLVVFLAKLVRRRRTVVWSAPHALWMGVILLNAVLFWIDSYRLRDSQSTSAVTVASLLLLSVGCFLQSELVAPGDAGADDFDLKAFHARHKGEYISVSVLYSLLLAAYVGWIALKNHWPVSMDMLVTTAVTVIASAAAILPRPGWVQIVAPLVVLGLKLAYLPMATAAMAQP